MKEFHELSSMPLFLAFNGVWALLFITTSLYHILHCPHLQTEPKGRKGTPRETKEIGMETSAEVYTVYRGYCLTDKQVDTVADWFPPTKLTMFPVKSSSQLYERLLHWTEVYNLWIIYTKLQSWVVVLNWTPISDSYILLHKPDDMIFPWRLFKLGSTGNNHLYMWGTGSPVSNLSLSIIHKHSHDHKIQNQNS